MSLTYRIRRWFYCMNLWMDFGCPRSTAFSIGREWFNNQEHKEPPCQP